MTVFIAASSTAVYDRFRLEAGDGDSTGQTFTSVLLPQVYFKQKTLAASAPAVAGLQRSRANAHARGDAVSGGGGSLNGNDENILSTNDVKGISTGIFLET